MNIRENVLISELTTMRLGGTARFVVEVTTPAEIPEAYQFAKDQGLPVWIMGGGANTIGREKFDGVIILNHLKGIELLPDNILKIAGGEDWDGAVEFACSQNLSGIEALSSIPGTAGAAPVQNIGAYGQEISQTLVEIEAFDTKENLFVTIPAADLNLNYRRSRLNFGPEVGRYFVASITLRLAKTTMQPPFYNSLQRVIDEYQITDFSPVNIRKIVSNIRAEKLPDPRVQASAGSFFKNVQLKTAAEVQTAKAKGIPVWENANAGEIDQNGQKVPAGKINSGWLIEQCGLKGQNLYGFKISEKAALILINESAQNYEDLVKARTEIIDQVERKFGYKLEQEPVEITESGNAVDISKN